MRTKFFAGVAFAALTMPAAAFAQSTGSIDFEGETEIVVTGTAIDGVGGIVIPDTSKARQVLTQEFIQRQAPGQSVNDIINQMPGVSFQNNDPFGSAGGTLTIRGFDNTRISQTFDGIPLNDSGGYSIYSNQQLDPELIEQVNVNLGTTDVDSPTASATGSTVNYRTRVPGRDFGVKLVGSAGDFSFFRIFGLVDTGEFTPWGTRAFFAASTASNDNVFNNRGQVHKQQYNARIYQPLGSSGDFLSLAGHYNENRNNFFGSVALRNDRAVPSGFPQSKDDRFYTIARCQINQVARPGEADAANTCGSTFDERYNPSNTGNVRGASRFTLGEGLVLTVDPSYQYVKANGGGTSVGQEGFRDVLPGAGVSNQTGYLGGSPYFGRDLNGDGDLLDTVRVLTPSQTQTHRIGVISSLRYDVNDFNTVRIAYTYDRARHRQTGEVGFLQANGEPFDVFPVNDGLTDAGGHVLQKRDRLSFAILHQVAGEYRGEFGNLTVNAGVRAPFFRRNLTNYCATSSAAGFVECFSSNAAGLAAYLAANPTQTAQGIGTFPTQGPQQRVFNYNRVLPNVGLTFDLTTEWSIFGSYSKGIQVPGTDNLYNSFYFPSDTDEANPAPETTDNFDLGLRFSSSNVQMQISGWYTNYQNRLAQAYDVDLDRSIYRNLGEVKKYGVDASVAVQPIRQLNVYAFASLLESEIQDDVQVGFVTGGANPGPRFAPTAGKREAGAPTFTVGGGFQADLGYFEIGGNIKHTGPRYIYDTNEPVRQLINGQLVQVFGATAPAYTLVDFNARLKLGWAGLNDKTYLQFNLLNAFDELYVGGYNGNLNNTSFAATTGVANYSSPPFVQIGYPRTFMGSLVVGF